jgi:excisionase family DNA binding protein
MGPPGNNGQIDATTPELLTAEEVAAILRIHPDRVYRLIREHRLPAVHLGRTVRVFRHILLSWMEAGGTASGDKTPTTFPREVRA